MSAQNQEKGVGVEQGGEIQERLDLLDRKIDEFKEMFELGARFDDYIEECRKSGVGETVSPTPQERIALALYEKRNDLREKAAKSQMTPEQQNFLEEVERI